MLNVASLKYSMLIGCYNREMKYRYLFICYNTVWINAVVGILIKNYFDSLVLAAFYK